MKEFQRYQAHLSYAHSCWKQIIGPGDTVIDATCGNGHDTLFLAILALTDCSGELYAFDIQPQAIENSKRLVKEQLPPSLVDRIHFIQRSHVSFPESLMPKSVKLIVYNLGYLPGSDKQITTEVESTLESIQKALPYICHSGGIFITCYPGHEEGKKEQDALLEALALLDFKEWSCCHHHWFNRDAAPSIIEITRKKVSN